MTRAIFGANAPAMPNRRAALGSLFSAAAALTLPPASVAASDPDAHLFALVEAGKHWFAKMESLSIFCDSVRARLEGRKVLPEHQNALDEAQDNYMSAFDEAMEISPQTVAGMRAQLEWIERDCAGLPLAEDHVHAMIASFLASPVLKA